jgi:osmotically-inducible protein OsmY
MSKDDVLLNDDVVEELKDDPAVDSSRIAIAVDDGVVTMTGSVADLLAKGRSRKCCQAGDRRASHCQ